jgi:hypothetical protein
VAILPIINRANTMIITPTIVHKIRCSSVLTFVLLNKIWVNIAAFSNPTEHVQVVKNVLFDASVGKPDNYKQVAYSVFKMEKM